jgi:16S rRNA processing protein RimM
MSLDTEKESWIALGKLAGAHGIKGWVKVQSFTAPKENILNYSPWYIKKDGQWVEVKNVSGKLQGKSIVVKLDFSPDRNVAETLKGCDIAVKPEQLEQLEQGEYYWRDLVGLEVINLEQIDLGRVDSLMETGANDVLVVKGKQDGERVERLIPYIPEEFIKQVDLEKGSITVDWDADF